MKLLRLVTVYVEKHSHQFNKSWKRDQQKAQRLVSHFGNCDLEEITTMGLVDFRYSRCQAGAKASTVNRDLAFIKSLFHKAIVWGFTDHNPATNVGMLREPRPRTRFAELKELNSIIDAFSGTLKDIVRFASTTGCRLSEILKLTWKDVDLGRGYFTVEESKNGQTRWVPMCSKTKVLLRGREHAGDYVFGTKHGNSYDPCYVSWKFHIRMVEVGIKDFRFHDLRHTFASHMRMAGADLFTLKEILGHKSMSMTQRYAHVSSQHKSNQMSLLDAYLGKTSPLAAVAHQCAQQSKRLRVTCSTKLSYWATSKWPYYSNSSLESQAVVTNQLLLPIQKDLAVATACPNPKEAAR